MKFSVGIPYGLKEWQIFFDIFFNDYFDGIELPADYLESEGLKLLLKKNKLKVINVVDILDLSLLRNVALQEQKVKNNIFEHITNLLSKNFRFKVENFLLDLGFSPTSKNADDDILRINFLKKFSYYLYYKKRNICLPVNVNSAFNNDSFYKYYLRILDNTMFYYFKLCINFFPHELKSDFPVKNLYKELIYYTKNIRLIYEPDTGNYLTEKLLTYWLKPASEYGFSGNIIILPKTNNEFIYESEVKKISTIIEKVKSKLL